MRGEAHLVDIWSRRGAFSPVLRHLVLAFQSLRWIEALLDPCHGAELYVCRRVSLWSQLAPIGAVSDQFYAHLVQGCEFTSHGFGFDVLIGRDIVRKGVLSLSSDGNYMLSF